MKKIHYLAAELFGYSYDNYEEKVSMNHIRFTKYMPETVKIFRKAYTEDWDDQLLAKKAEIDLENISIWREKYLNAVKIIEAGSPDKQLEAGLDVSIRIAIESGLNSDEQIGELIEQIKYRFCDFGNLIKHENRSLSEYSDYFRYGDFDEN